ncbi:hypothetical protein CapIbe_015775 [Capra ibex]
MPYFSNRGEPRPGGPELRLGAHCPAVCLSGGGAQGPGAPRSAEAPGTNHWDSGEFTLLRGNCTRSGDMIEDCLKAASFATSCGGLSLPFAVSFFFWRHNLLKKTSGGSHWCRLQDLTSRGHVTCQHLARRW